MISGKQTNFVFLSKLITNIEHYSSFWNELKILFEEIGIKYDFLDNTEDIWVKDYMPFQAKENEFVQFAFFPEQATTENHEPAQSNPLRILNTLKFKNVIQSEFIIDGRDIVCSDKKVIISDRVLHANSFIKDKKKFENYIAELLDLTEVIFLPMPKKNSSWHIDSLLRLMNNNTLLISDLSHVKKSWVKEFEKDLHITGKLLMNFPSALNVEHEDGSYSSTQGCYLNFVQVENNIIFPHYNIPEDEIALTEIKKLYPYCKIYTIDCTVLAAEGAGLSSIMWNIKK